MTEFKRNYTENMHTKKMDKMTVVKMGLNKNWLGILVCLVLISCEMLQERKSKYINITLIFLDSMASYCIKLKRITELWYEDTILVSCPSVCVKWELEVFQTTRTGDFKVYGCTAALWSNPRLITWTKLTIRPYS